MYIYMYCIYIYKMYWYIYIYTHTHPSRAFPILCWYCHPHFRGWNWNPFFRQNPRSSWLDLSCFRPFSFPEWTPPWFFASTSLRVEHSQNTLHNSTVNVSLNNFQKQLPKNRAVEGFLNSRDRYSVMFTDVKTVVPCCASATLRSLLPAGLGASESSSGSSAVKSGPRLRFTLAQSEAAPEPQKSVPRSWTAVYFF